MDVCDPGTILVIGTGPGTGDAILRRFAQAGFNVAMVARKLDHIGPLADEIIASGGKALAEVTDITDEGLVEALFTRAEAELGPVTIAVFNASYRVQKPFAEIEMEEFRQTLDTNLIGAFLMARQAAKVMGPRGRGSIFFTGAQSTFRGRAGLAAFGMAKAGIRGLALGMAEDLGPAGIHVANFNIDGPIDNEKTRLRDPHLIGTGRLIDTGLIAEAYYQTHLQPAEAWDFDVDIRSENVGRVGG
ncbi:MAG: SDR family NAD(P)-dependent oxidoreductase [Rhodospirillales bacterium]|nr:SDR family NAD(P)-dependent oxidoreductase [Rhodospirillales bacterium]